MKEELPVIIDYTPKSLSYKGKKFMRKIPSLLKIYLISIFPIIQWIHRYNTTWLVQDMIAGITVGIVIVPQSMAYAKVANLDPQYGLYSSFVGSTLYCFFGTSKDISVGPISTVSLLISTAVNSVINANPNITPAEVAVSLGLHAGIISIVISLLRLGILVDFIPEPAIAGYMTGSAITIVISQWPKLFGIPDVSTHASPYMIFGQFFAKISHTHIDVAFGLSSLVFLYSVRYICVKIKPQSRILQKFVFLFGIMRNGLIVIVGTIISFLINMGRDDSLFSIIKTVPAGFDAMAVPRLHLDIFKKAGGIIPSIVLILVLEHISVAKSFGRICDYQIDPDQEILAIGMSNVIGSFFGGFPSTGAFSRTAIMARSGSRTPMAGVFSGAVVLLALYALTPAFYYIPDAVLAAVVIHAVSDLVSGSKYLKQLWHSNPIEIAVWAGAVIVTIFIDVQAGIYTAVGLSLIVMLYKMARPAVTVLSRVPSIQGPNKSGTMALETDENYFYVNEMDSNFQDNLVKLPKGILVLKLSDSIIYPNAEYISDKIVHIVKQRTRCANILDINKSNHDRLWNQGSQENFQSTLPVLEVIILDFSAVSRLDSTALQMLRTTQDTIDRYTGKKVEWHFAGLCQSVRRSLLYAQFGLLEGYDINMKQCSSSTSSDKSLISSMSDKEQQRTTSSSELKPNKTGAETGFMLSQHSVHDFETGSTSVTNTNPNNSDSTRKEHMPIDRYPCFHWDVNTAVRRICKKRCEA